MFHANPPLEQAEEAHARQSRNKRSRIQLAQPSPWVNFALIFLGEDLLRRLLSRLVNRPVSQRGGEKENSIPFQSQPLWKDSSLTIHILILGLSGFLQGAISHIQSLLIPVSIVCAFDEPSLHFCKYLSGKLGLSPVPHNPFALLWSFSADSDVSFLSSHVCFSPLNIVPPSPLFHRILITFCRAKIQAQTSLRDVTSHNLAFFLSRKKK